MKIWIAFAFVTSVAVLSAVDDVATSTSGEDHPVFTIARLQHDLAGQSRIGFVYTDKIEGSYSNRVVVHNAPRYHSVVRRPIFVARPVIHQRYFSYYQRPALIVENYSATPGYFWVPGAWSWNGYEWIWQPGHYQPDPNYIDPGYEGY